MILRVTPRRTYGDRCGIARGLDLVGERWALLIIRDLLLGPKRFTDLREGLPNLSPDVLSQRLRELESAGVLSRRRLPPPAASRVYELTEWGQELEPVVLGLGRWGASAPVPPGDPPLGVDSAMIALKTMFSPAAADGIDAGYELRFGEHRFRAHVSGGQLSVSRGGAERPDAVIDTDPATLAELVWHGRQLTKAIDAGEVKLEGSLPAAEAFLRLFGASQ
jgi:DNA-binding HxlR family transcriptional regulator